MMPVLRSRLVQALGVAVSLAVFASWPSTAVFRGWMMAYLDHACGHSELKMAGAPPADEREVYEEYARLLEARYGVVLTFDASATISREHCGGYIGGNDSVSRRLLLERHGKDIFFECSDAAWRGRSP
jgi:hypothetical protein